MYIEIFQVQINENVAPVLAGQSRPLTNETTTIQPYSNTIEDKNWPSAVAVAAIKNNFLKDEITIEVSSKSIVLKMPKNDTDIQFIRTFKFVRWDNVKFRWVIPNYGKNLELIKNYFNTRISRIETRLIEQPRAIRNFGTIQIVTDLPKIDSESLQEIERFKQWMEQKRYSDSTVKTYIGAITVFLRFIKPRTSAEATNQDMQRFVYQYMIPRKLSFSYQNQAVNHVG